MMSKQEILVRKIMLVFWTCNWKAKPLFAINKLEHRIIIFFAYISFKISKTTVCK